MVVAFVKRRRRSAGKADKVAVLADTAMAAGRNNVAFLCALVLGNVDLCLDQLVATNRLPEAAMFARTYVPSRMSEVVKLWKEDLASEPGKTKCSQALAGTNMRFPRQKIYVYIKQKGDG